jgi:predicted heme/steroid binding protein
MAPLRWTIFQKISPPPSFPERGISPPFGKGRPGGIFPYEIFLALASTLVLLALAAPALALPEYSARTGEGCRTCHLGEMGGALGEKGLEYAASGYVWPPAGGYRVIGPIRKPVRLLIGLLHVTASFLWFGTILYVHLLLRPAYAAKGLPRGEVLLGLASMSTVGLTGALLTVSRIRGLEVLYASPWGIMLSIKMTVYLVMVSSAAFVITFVGPRLRKGGVSAEAPKDGVFGTAALSQFDGKDGRPAFVAYKGVVYDVTGSNRWKDGTHIKHRAGEDLTAALPKAPHGEEKLMPFKKAGTFDALRRPPRGFAERAFYFVAYMNLALVFLVLFVLSYWRWGI